MRKRVAVVGAGPSGLVTLKELLDEGHEPTCFERAGGPGGVFRFAEQDGVVWESCHLTSSPLLTSFSDFPALPNQIMHLSAAEYVEYLGRYCETFDLLRHVRFATSVQEVRRGADGTWVVRTCDASGVHEERFDAVAICSGLHQHPHVPNFPGRDSFTGAVLHASQYRRPSQIEGKRVLVVGAGESGADITAEVAAHAADTVLSLRRGVAVQSRKAFGRPRDLLTSRLMGSPAHWVFQTRHPDDNRKRAVYRWAFLPMVFVDKGLQLSYRLFWEFLPLLFAPTVAGVRANLATRRLTKRLLAESGGTANEQFGTKTDDFVRALATGRCRRATAITRFESSRVYFSDGSEYEPDIVIFCTGFETRTPFLDPATSAAPRFLHAFAPEIGASLGFIGFLRPAYGAIPPLAELQARWFALLQSGRVDLPPMTVMQSSIAQWTTHRAHVFRAVRGRLEHLVDHAPFCDALAAQVGCLPTRRDIRSESRRFRRRFVAAPFTPAQYRLVGPHAKPALARAVIENLPIAHPWPDRINLHLRGALSRLLYRLLGPDYAPALTLRNG